MDLQLSFSNAAVEVHAAGHGVTRLRWKPGPRALGDFQAGMEALLCSVRRLGTGKTLVDQRAMSPLTPAEQAWVVGHWLPRARAQGHYRYAAVLPSPDANTEASVAAVRRQAVPDEPRYVEFQDEEAALLWLRRQVIIRSYL